MNPFLIKLSETQLKESPELSPEKFVIEDNVGESLHIHYRNMRIEMSVNEFREFANQVSIAAEELEKWE